MKPDLGIKEQNLTEINDLLNHVLADGNVLYIKLRKFHWNLSGDNFMELHKLFEEQYDAVAEAIDEVAERISTLGGIAIGTTSEFAELSLLIENPGKIFFESADRRAETIRRRCKHLVDFRRQFFLDVLILQG